MDNKKTAGSNLTSIAEYSETAMVMADLRKRHEGVVYDVATPKQMKLAKEARAEIRGYRVALEKTRVEIKAPALERCRQIDSEAKRLTAALVELEEPIDVQIKAEEARAETERLAKLEAERLRVEAIQQKIQAIRDVPASLVGKPSVIIAGQLAKLRETTLEEAELGADYLTAADALAAAVARVQELLAAQKDAEAEQAKIKAEREELERVRAENERLQREADERAAADRAEADRKAQAERDRIAAEEQAKRDAEQAEQERLAAIERGKAMEAAAAERDRLAAERAELEAQQQAERERQAAEQKKLDEQAAQLKRDQQAAAAKAETDRLANLGLREAAQAVIDFAADHYDDEQVFVDLRAALANDEAAAKPSRTKKVAA